MKPLAVVQEQSRKHKASLFYKYMRPTEKDSVLIFGSGDGTDFLSHYPWPERVTAIDHNSSALFELHKRWPMVRTIHADLCQTSEFAHLDNHSFSIGYSNAVLEHVPCPQFVADLIRRLCPKYYVTTPNKLFPFDMHTRLPLYHYFGEPTQRTLVTTLRPGNYKDGIYEAVHPLTPKDAKHIFPHATIKVLWPGYTLLIYSP